MNDKPFSFICYAIYKTELLTITRNVIRKYSINLYTVTEINNLRAKQLTVKYTRSELTTLTEDQHNATRKFGPQLIANNRTLSVCSQQFACADTDYPLFRLLHHCFPSLTNTIYSTHNIVDFYIIEIRTISLI